MITNKQKKILWLSGYNIAAFFAAFVPVSFLIEGLTLVHYSLFSVNITLPAWILALGIFSSIAQTLFYAWVAFLCKSFADSIGVKL